MRFQRRSRARLHPGGRPAPAPVRRARRAALRAGGWRLRGGSCALRTGPRPAPTGSGTSVSPSLSSRPIRSPRVRRRGMRAVRA